MALPINDKTIKVVPSVQLTNVIKSMSGEPFLPESIRDFITDASVINEQYEQATKLLKQLRFNSNERTSDETLLKKQHIERESFQLKSALMLKDKHPNLVKIQNGMRTQPFGDKILTLNDLQWLQQTMVRLRKQNKDLPYFHDVLRNCRILLPANEIMQRNPELEARCQKLRREQEAKEYEAITRNVDNMRTFMPQETIAYQTKQINRQLIAVAQFLFSVLAGFAFGFIGVELIVGQLDFGFRLLLGIMTALIIALAEIYFLAKKLNEDYDVLTNFKQDKLGGIEKKNIEAVQIGSNRNLADRKKIHLD